MHTTPRRAIGAAAALTLLAGTLAGCSATSSSSSSAGSGDTAQSNVATDDYTPHVKQGTPVVVEGYGPPPDARLQSMSMPRVPVRKRSCFPLRNSRSSGPCARSSTLWTHSKASNCC